VNRVPDEQIEQLHGDATERISVDSPLAHFDLRQAAVMDQKRGCLAMPRRSTDIAP